ncbi:gas vesicle protein K [Acidobacteria bacterium AH-259-G07]|nr:gas vesicle protein K [Acidobacteria bacterium AH-259-G07]
MPIDINESNLKHGVLGLVIALVEIIRDALKLQALRRMEGGSLTEEETDRLGRALKELDVVLEQIKEEQGVTEAVRSVREGLDDVVDDVLDQMINPAKWEEGVKHSQEG